LVSRTAPSRWTRFQIVAWSCTKPATAGTQAWQQCC
jgi:hypothetical protein